MMQVILVRLRMCSAAGKIKSIIAANGIHAVITQETTNVSQARELLMVYSSSLLQWISRFPDFIVNAHIRQYARDQNNAASSPAGNR